MERNRLSALPIELKENILFYLPSVLDRYNLAQACTEFNEYLQSNIVRSLDLSLDIRLYDEILLNIFNWFPNPSNVTHLNLNGLYWIDPEIIKYATIKFTNLESLFIVDTKVYAVQENLEVLSKMKRLHIIAIEKDPPSCHLYRTFVIVRNDKQQPCINERHKFQGNMTTIEVTLRELAVHMGFLNEGSWINEICNSRRYVEYCKRQLKSDKENRMEIDYDNLLNFRGKQNLPPVTELLIRDPPVNFSFRGGRSLSLQSIRRLNEISLEPITCFRNLRKLDLDFPDGVKITHLHELFKGCKFLKSLKIANIKSYVALYYAKSLEEVSLYTKGYFNFNNTFGCMYAPENVKLKRILLKCEIFHISSYENFEEFLNKNPALMFFHVECNESNFDRGKMKRTMEDSRKRPSQHFEINMDPNLRVKGIPLSHIDMMPLYQCNLCFYKS